MNILVIEDNRETRRKIVADLEQNGFKGVIFEAVDGLDGFYKASQKLPDIILCDIEMPRMDGLKFLTAIRSNAETKHIPVLLLTSSTNREIRLKGLTTGAHDFIHIPYDSQELAARAKLHLNAKQREDELRKRNKELEQLSNKDCLTGAFNRRYLCHILNVELGRAARTDGMVSVLMLDIDHFKEINDRFGHQAGDLVLKKVTAEATACLRNYDLFFRYGGEEFVVMLPDTSNREALKVAERLCNRVRTLLFNQISPDLRVTVSIGVAAYPDNDVCSVEELLAHADQALYQAKQNGRDQVMT